ncbi:MAG: PDZ domain-containing protein, partial [candidate division Zixibacteria bacterium]|nr:PDZ domain-containing protein [candidate division Zixibacteria bacterium]
AIPINLARAIVPDLIASGRPTRGWLGVYMSNVTERQAKHMGLSAVRGIVIDSVFAGSPADRAGMKRGDVVVEFNNQEVANGSQFSVLVATVRQGNSIPVEVIREGEHINLSATIGDRDSGLAESPEGGSRGEQREMLLGMELSRFTAGIAAEIGAEHVDGLYVWRVYPGTPADLAGITAGSIIMKVGNNAVKTVEEFVASIREEPDRSHIPLIVQEPDGAIARKILRP